MEPFEIFVATTLGSYIVTAIVLSIPINSERKKYKKTYSAHKIEFKPEESINSVVTQILTEHERDLRKRILAEEVLINNRIKEKRKNGNI